MSIIRGTHPSESKKINHLEFKQFKGNINSSIKLQGNLFLLPIVIQFQERNLTNTIMSYTLTTEL